LDNGNIEVISWKMVSEKIIDAEGMRVGVQKGNTLNYNERRDSGKNNTNQLIFPMGKPIEIGPVRCSSVFYSGIFHKVSS